MADKPGSGTGDIFSGKSVGEMDNATESTNELSDAQRQLVDNADELKKQIDADTEALKDYGRASDDTKRKVETLGEAWKRQADSIKTTANSVFTLNSRVHELGGGLTGFMNKMKDATSIAGYYNRALKELDQSQKTYVGSLNLTTATQGAATAQHTKFLKAINEGNIRASVTAGKYSMATKEVQETQAKVVSTFGSQLIAYKDNDKALASLTEQTIVMSKYMGVDAAGAADYMRTRLEYSGKTLKEVQEETKAVTVAADEYSKTLAGLSDEVLKTANISRKELLSAVQDASKAFEQGVFNAVTYTEALGPLIIKMKEMGGTKAELSMLVKGFQRFSKALMDPGLNSFFGIKGAQMVARNLDLIKDPKVRMRVEHAIEASNGDINDPQAIRRILESMSGSTAHMFASMMELNKVGNMKTRKELIYTHTKSQRAADIIAETMGPGSEAMQAFEKGSNRTEKETRVLQDAMDKIKGAVKKGQDTTSPAHKTALKMRELQERILNLMKYYYPAMLLAMGAQAVGSFLKGGGGIASKLAGGAGALTGGAGAVAGATGVLGKGGSAQASRIAARAATREVTLATARRAAVQGGGKVALTAVAKKGATTAMLKTAAATVGKRLAARAVLGAVPVVGQVAMAALTTYEVLNAANVYGGKYMKTKLSKQNRAMVGKDSDVLDMIGTKIRSKQKGFEFLNNVTRERGHEVGVKMAALVDRYTKIELEMRDHERGTKTLNKKEWLSRKKFLKEHERAVRLQKKFNRESDRDSNRIRTRVALNSLGDTGQEARTAGQSEKEYKKQIQAKIDTMLFDTQGSHGELRKVLQGKKSSAGPVQDALTHTRMASEAKKIGMNPEAYKKLILKRLDQDFSKGDAGLDTKLEAFSATGGVSPDVLQQQRANQDLARMQQAVSTSGILPASIQKDMAAQRAAEQTVQVAASVESAASGTPGNVHYNPVDNVITMTSNNVIVQKFEGRGLAKGMAHMIGQETPNTTNAPGK